MRLPHPASVAIAVVLATLGELGFHDLAWRVLDSRHFGVPQRRRRVFILARRARGRSCAEVLLEPEGGGGDHQAGSEARARVAATLSHGSSRPGVSAPGRRQEATTTSSTPLRRLTPSERERLQGFPTGWTIPYGPSLAPSTRPQTDPESDRWATPSPCPSRSGSDEGSSPTRKAA